MYKFMMSKLARFVVAGLAVAWIGFPLMSSAQWKPQPAKLMTKWAGQVDPTKTLQEYPRPQLVRSEWQNMNGLWDYAVTPLNVTKPTRYDGQILVPFPFQSALSGVMKPFDVSQRLWYHHLFNLPADWTKAGQRVLLHFGAVSWQADVFINGKPIGTHRGDYDAFTVDVTSALNGGSSMDVMVAVTDPIDTGAQPRGKQARESKAIWYTASTGIWRTVWAEPVAAAAIDGLKIVPDVDGGAVKVTAAASGTDTFDRVEVSVLSSGKEINRADGNIGSEISIPIANAHLWDFNDPFLYDLKVTLYHGSGPSDEVTSYFGMRKVSMAKDDKGVLRPMLNNKFVFQLGVLDQGFWPGGLYTAPSDEALRFDVDQIKKYGFNVARKHVKVAPDRWYYWCDKLGVGVWQDMPSSDPGDDTRLKDAEAAQFQTELKAMVDGLENHPSVIQWVLFNEGWGQHDTISLTKWLMEYDPTRLCDSASGWNHLPAGQVFDEHSYPGPSAFKPNSDRILAQGEFGGITTQVPGHMWTDASQTFGYNKIGDVSLLTTDYPDLMKKVWPLIANPGLSAAIYTQLTDVGQETNGLMTYDRLPKIDPSVIRSANLMPAGTPGAFVPAALQEEPATVPATAAAATPAAATAK